MEKLPLSLPCDRWPWLKQRALGTVPLPACHHCHQPVLDASAAGSTSCPSAGRSWRQQPARSCPSRAAKCCVEAGKSMRMVFSTHSSSTQGLAFVPALQLVYARSLWHIQQQRWHFLCCLVPALSKHSGWIRAGFFSLLCRSSLKVTAEELRST